MFHVATSKRASILTMISCLSSMMTRTVRREQCLVVAALDLDDDDRDTVWGIVLPRRWSLPVHFTPSSLPHCHTRHHKPAQRSNTTKSVIQWFLQVSSLWRLYNAQASRETTGWRKQSSMLMSMSVFTSHQIIHEGSQKTCQFAFLPDRERRDMS